MERSLVGRNRDWLEELQAALPAANAGALPPALPPFRMPSGSIYLPIVVKTETADEQLRRVVVIFVSAGIERLLPMLGWPFPSAMPDNLKYIVRLIRSMFTVRWEILEPRYQEARFRSPNAERCEKITQAVIRDLDEMQKDFDEGGQAGVDKFFRAFRKDLRPELEVCSEEWIGLMKKLHDDPMSEADKLSAALEELLNNNVRWLSVAAKQFSDEISDLQ